MSGATDTGDIRGVEASARASELKQCDVVTWGHTNNMDHVLMLWTPPDLRLWDFSMGVTTAWMLLDLEGWREAVAADAKRLRISTTSKLATKTTGTLKLSQSSFVKRQMRVANGV